MEGSLNASVFEMGEARSFLLTERGGGAGWVAYPKALSSSQSVSQTGFRLSFEWVYILV